MKIQEFKLIESSNSAELTVEVNDFLSAGWKLYGFPSVAASQFGTSYVQAVTREVEQPEAWG